MSHTLCVFLVLSGLVSCLDAQVTARQSGSVMGEVDTGGEPCDTLSVVLSASGEPDRRVDLRIGGAFDFRDVPFGQYELKVVTLHGEVTHREFFFLNSAYRLSVRLPRNGFVRTATSTVSAARLRHDVPAKARKEFARASEASRKNDSPSAVEHLARAIELDPDFMEAHYNLGVQYLQSGQFPLALPEFEKAVVLDPGVPAAWVNLASTWLHLKRLVEAEAAARKAIRLDGTNAVARYCLGLALLSQAKKTPEALANLKIASETLASARIALAATH